VPEAIPTHDMAGLAIARFSPEQAAEHVQTMLLNGSEGLAIHFLTAHTISVAEADSGIRDILRSGDLLLPDSRWLELLSGFRKRKLTQVRGPDFFRRLLRSPSEEVEGHFFVGPSDEVNSALEKALREQFPEARVAGFSVGPHRPLTSDELRDLATTINATGSPLVWVGVGTPAQNVLAHHLAKESGRVIIGVGAAFEFLSGKKTEAPSWVSRMGIEWLFRLVTEPKRLWRRYLIGNAVFLFALLKHRLISSS
jgi:N-acetylglucosaminyldiphosphoundecaprenol N-acetyl-beta-D-mannosaminyltransferase